MLLQNNVNNPSGGEIWCACSRDMTVVKAEIITEYLHLNGSMEQTPASLDDGRFTSTE